MPGSGDNSLYGLKGRIAGFKRYQQLRPGLMLG